MRQFMALPAENEQPGKLLPWRQRAAAMEDGVVKSPAVEFAARVMGEAYASVIVTPRGYIQAIGDRDAAAMIAQVQYLQQQRGPWFPYSASDWERDLGISKHIMNQCIKTLEAFGLCVKTLPTKPSVTTHWYIDEAQLAEALTQFVQRVNIYPLNTGDTPQTGEMSPVNRRDFTQQQVKSDPLTDKISPIYRDREDKDLGDTEANASLADDASASSLTPPLPSNKNKGNAATRRAPEDVKPLTPAQEKAYQENLKIALHFRATIKGYCPSAAVPEPVPKAMQGWVTQIRLMREQDERTPSQIREVIDFLAATPKEQPWHLSPKKIRANFDALTLKIKLAKEREENQQGWGNKGSPAQTSKRKNVTVVY
jgi:hypothetical protein